MKYYIKVENDIIIDILSYSFQDYFEIEVDLYRYKYALHSRLYNYVNEKITLNTELEKKFLEEAEDVN